MSIDANACLLFFNPHNTQKNGYAFTYPKSLNELPAIKAIFSDRGIKDIRHDGLEIPSQDVLELAAVETKMALCNSRYLTIDIYCEESNHQILRRLFKSKKHLRFNAVDSFQSERPAIITEDSLSPLKKLIVSRPNLPLLGSEGGTLLHFAAERGQGVLFDMLLECGADVHQTKTDDSTVLHSAVSQTHQHNASFTRKILAKGGDVNAATIGGKTPLHIAALQLDSVSESVIELLLESGANVRAKDLNDATPLHYAVAMNQEPIGRLLVKYGADVNASCSWVHRTPFSLAFSRGNIELLKLLFEAKANDRTNPELLRDALRHAQLDVLQLLLESGLDPNYVDENGRKCMAFISHQCSTEVIECLIRFGARFRYSDLKHLKLCTTLMQAFLGYCPVQISVGNLQKLCNPSRTNNEIERHLVKLEILRPYSNILKQHPVTRRRLSEIKLRHSTFLQKCQVEVEELDDNVGDSRLKYRDILTSDCATRYVKNPKVIKAMEEVVAQSRFPIYSNMLMAKFKVAVWRKTMGDQVIPIMRFLLSQFSPTNQQGHPALADELIEIIVSYLSVRDLVVLRKFLRIQLSFSESEDLNFNILPHSENESSEQKEVNCDLDVPPPCGFQFLEH